MTTDPMTEAVEAANLAYGWATTNRQGQQRMQAAIQAALPILRTQFAEEVATAIEAEHEAWRVAGPEPMTEFPLHSTGWFVKRAYESTAAIARNLGTK